jgi:hypothetical protein
VLTIAFASKPVQFCAPNVENRRLVGRFGFGATLMVNELRTAAKSHGLSLPVMMFGRRGLFAIKPTSFDDKNNQLLHVTSIG